MKRASRLLVWLLLPLLLGLPGCDIAVGVYFATKKKSSKSSSTNTQSSPDSSYHVFVKQVAAGTETSEENTITNAGNGNPGTVGWADIGSAFATHVFPLPAIGTFNSIAISANDLTAYSIESVELLNASGDVTEVASGTTYHNTLISNPNNILGAPNGSVAITAADASHNAYVFTVYGLANSPTKVRINTWSTAPGSGDIDQRQIGTRGGIQRAGGAALKNDGTLYALAKDDFGPNRDVLLFKFPSSGGPAPTPTLIDSGGTTPLGNNTVVISPTDQVFLATTAPGSINPSSIIHVQKLEGIAPLWSQTYGLTTTLNRVEAHGLALDAAGNLVLGGAFDFGAATGGIGPFLRKLSGTDGSQLWALPPGPPGPPYDANDDYWYGVAAASGDFFSTGDQQLTPPTGSIQVYTQQVDGSDANNGAKRWEDYKDGPNAPNTNPDRGNSVAVSTTGDAYVGGFYGSNGPARNAVIIRYPVGTSPGSALIFFSTSANSDSEILDIAVDSSGFVFATGYETITLGTTRKNLFLVKLASDGSLIWKRTYNGGFGDDRGVSLIQTASHIYVFGETTVGAGDVDVFYLRFLK
jgi:hypothetical protein